MDTLVIFSLASSVVVLTALCIGAWSDVKTRTSPKWVWGICAPFAFVTTTINYVVIYISDKWAFLGLFITSAILCLFCMLMAYRMGNGGDWRALFYISLLTPWAAPATLLFSAIIGAIQIVVEKLWLRHEKVPWMVSITIAFVAATVLYIIQL